MYLACCDRSWQPLRRPLRKTTHCCSFVWHKTHEHLDSWNSSTSSHPSTGPALLVTLECQVSMQPCFMHHVCALVPHVWLAVGSKFSGLCNRHGWHPQETALRRGLLMRLRACCTRNFNTVTLLLNHHSWNGQ